MDYDIPNFNQVHPHSPPSMVCFAVYGLSSKAIRHALESKKPPLSYTRFEPRASPKDRIFSRTRTEIRKGSKKESQTQVSEEATDAKGMRKGEEVKKEVKRRGENVRKRCNYGQFLIEYG